MYMYMYMYTSHYIHAAMPILMSPRNKVCAGLCCMRGYKFTSHTNGPHSLSINVQLPLCTLIRFTSSQRLLRTSDTKWLRVAHRYG